MNKLSSIFLHTTSFTRFQAELNPRVVCTQAIANHLASAGGSSISSSQMELSFQKKNGTLFLYFMQSQPAQEILHILLPRIVARSTCLAHPPPIANQAIKTLDLYDVKARTTLDQPERQGRESEEEDHVQRVYSLRRRRRTIYKLDFSLGKAKD